MAHQFCLLRLMKRMTRETCSFHALLKAKHRAFEKDITQANMMTNRQKPAGFLKSALATSNMVPLWITVSHNMCNSLVSRWSYSHPRMDHFYPSNLYTQSVLEGKLGNLTHTRPKLSICALLNGWCWKDNEYCFLCVILGLRSALINNWQILVRFVQVSTYSQKFLVMSIGL